MGKIKIFAITAVLAASALAFTLPADRVAAGANQCTWTGAGADDNWSTTANWTCSVGTVPATGYDIIFPMSLAGGSANQLNNDLPATNEYAGIWFTDNASCTGDVEGYYIYGNGFQLAGDIIQYDDNSCDQTTFFYVDTIVLNAPAIFDVAGQLYIQEHTATGSGPYNPTTLSLGSNSLTVTATTASSYQVLRDIAGTGDITYTGTGSPDFWHGSDSANFSSFDGDIVIDQGTMFARTSEAFGTATGQTIINSDARMHFYVPSTTGLFTIADDLIINGTDSIGFNQLVLNSQNESYALPPGYTIGQMYFPSNSVEFTGDVTLNADLTTFAANDGTFSGNLSGSFTMNNRSGGGGDIIINGATNTTSTANGTYSVATDAQTLSDLDPASDVIIYRGGIGTINGSRKDIWVAEGGIFKGTGTVANVWSFNGIVSPGLSPGIISTGDLSFDSGTTVDIELEGTTPGPTGHDQFDVTGTVSLGDATLNTILFNGYTPTVSDTFVIINNDGADAVTGTFGGLAEGASFNVGAYAFTISYVGGDGNDVVLTTSYEPGPPGTGFGIALQRNNLPFTILAIGSVLLIAEGLRRRYYRVG